VASLLSVRVPTTSNNPLLVVTREENGRQAENPCAANTFWATILPLSYDVLHVCPRYHANDALLVKLDNPIDRERLNSATHLLPHGASVASCELEPFSGGPQSLEVEIEQMVAH